MKRHYRSRLNSSYSQQLSKLNNFVGFFVIAVLLFAVLGGVLKNSSFSSDDIKPSWDSNSSFVIALNTDPVSVVAYNPSTKQITLVKFDDNLYVAAETIDNNIEKLSAFKNNGENLRMATSLAALSPVLYSVNFEEKKEVSKEELEKDFKAFASLFSPVKIALFGLGGVEETNIARIDLIKLWWQAKSLSVNDLKYIDASNLSQDIILSGEETVLGVDDVSLNRVFASVVENRKILEEGYEIEIVDGSAALAVGHIAESYIASFGGKVASYASGSETERCTLQTDDSKGGYTGQYLAKVFRCDIKPVPEFAPNTIRLIIGKEFAQNF